MFRKAPHYMLTMFVLVAALLVAAPAFALDLEWLITHIEVDEQQPVDMAATSDGGCVVVARDDNVTTGTSDVLVTRFDMDGTQLWAYQYDSMAHDRVYAVEVLASSRIYVCTMHTENPNLFPYEPRILEFNDLGILLNEYDFTATDLSIVADIRELSDGQLIVTGANDTGDINDPRDAYVASIGTDASLVWETTVNADWYDVFTEVEEAPNGELILHGYALQSGGVVEDNLITRVDQAGDVIWSNVYPGLGFPDGLSLDGDGTIFAGATTTGDEDYSVTRLDGDGNELWTQTYNSDSGLDSEDHLEDVLVYDGELILAGRMASANDLYGLLHLDLDGNVTGFTEMTDVKYTVALAESYDGHLLTHGAVGGTDDQDDIFAALFSNPADATISVMPISDTQLPASGGTLDYQVTVVNNYGSYTTNARVRIEYLPTGNGPVTRTFNNFTLPEGTTVRDLSQDVPANAPAGDYELFVEIYNNPNNILLSGSFLFSKSESGAMQAGGGVQGWSAHGEFAPVAGRSSELSAATPADFALQPAYPNPFNPSTTVALTLPSHTQMTVAVYNTVGQRVATLAKGAYAAGQHRFTFDARHLASGVYFIHAEASGLGTALQRVTLMK